jgi:hypothetical protein
MKKIILGLSIFAAVGFSGIQAASILANDTLTVVDKDKDGEKKKKSKEEKSTAESKDAKSCCKKKSTSCHSGEKKAQ